MDWPADTPPALIGDRMRGFPRLPLALIVCLLAASLAGCGRRTTPAEAGIETQTLLVGNAAEPDDLDPSVLSTWWAFDIDHALFQALTDIDEVTTKPVPALATGWDVSPDGLVYTFHLRPDARWSDGDPVTAGDFIYTFHRELSPNFAAGYSYMLWPIRNAEAFNSGKITDFSQVGVKAIDPLTLQVTLAKPTPYLPALAAHNTWMPVHQACVEKYGKMEQRGTRWTLPGNMVSNGPYVLKEWSPNSRVVVEKNPLYWDAAHVRLNRIIFFPIENEDSEELNFRDGQLDVTWAVPMSRVDWYRKHDPAELRIEDELAVYFLYFNVQKPPFDNPKVRRALSLAVDRTRISRDVLKGIQTPAHNFTPPNCGGYTARAYVPDDFAAARRLLAEAGYPGGRGLPTVNVLSYSTDVGIRTMEVVQETWKNQLGFQIHISPVEAKTLFANQQTGDFTIAFSAWIADYPDPSTFLDLQETGNGNNYSRYSNSAYDHLIESARSDQDPVRRFEEYQRAEAMMLQDAPLVPLFFGQRPYLVKRFVHGWPNSQLGFKRFQNAWLGN